MAPGIEGADIDPMEFDQYLVDNNSATSTAVHSTQNIQLMMVPHDTFSKDNENLLELKPVAIASDGKDGGRNQLPNNCYFASNSSSYNLWTGGLTDDKTGY